MAMTTSSLGPRSGGTSNANKIASKAPSNHFFSGSVPKPSLTAGFFQSFSKTWFGSFHVVCRCIRILVNVLASVFLWLRMVFFLEFCLLRVGLSRFLEFENCLKTLLWTQCENFLVVLDDARKANSHSVTIAAQWQFLNLNKSNTVFLQIEN